MRFILKITLKKSESNITIFKMHLRIYNMSVCRCDLRKLFLSREREILSHLDRPKKRERTGVRNPKRDIGRDCVCQCDGDSDRQIDRQYRNTMQNKC